MTTHTSFKKQLEPLKNYPLRPAMATMSLDSGYTVIEDAAPVAWTNAALRVGNGGILNISKTMDDDSKITTDDSTVNLSAGIWEVRVCVHVVEGSAAAEDMRVAVTNLAGSTVYLESDPFEIPASGDFVYTATVIATLTSADGINIRCASTTAADLTVQPAFVGYVKRIGNADEA